MFTLEDPFGTIRDGRKETKGREGSKSSACVHHHMLGIYTGGISFCMASDILFAVCPWWLIFFFFSFLAMMDEVICIVCTVDRSFRAILVQ